MLRGALDSARDAVLVLDENGSILEVNAAAAALLGHAKARLIGKPLAAMIDLETRRGFRNAFGSLRPGETPTCEVRLLGGEEPLHLTLRTLPRVSPRSVTVVFHRDGAPAPVPAPPTELQRLDHLVLRYPAGAVAIDRSSRVVIANSAARRLLGRDVVRSGSTLLGAGPTELQPWVRRLAETGTPLAPTTVDLADGRALRISGIAATHDVPAILFLEDITEETRRNRVMHEFLRNAAHQLRTPLAGITSAIETLQAGAKDDVATRDRFLVHLETHAQRLNRIARVLLTLARAETGEVIAVDVVELKPLVDSIVASADPPDGVEVRAHCPKGLAAIATPDLLREAVAALVDNALAHSRRGEVRISANQDGGEVALTVSDSGPGILPEFQDRIFEPFFRLAPDGEGYGLGLAIAAQAARAMHGKIDVVSSAPLEGTVFRMTLPAATVKR